MARSTEVLFALVLMTTACSNVPSKKTALEIVTRDVQEDSVCTLDAKTLGQLKMQYTTKAACVPKEGAKPLEACIAALVAAGATKEKPVEYMRQWPDELAMTSLKDVPASSRSSRSLLFASCVEMSNDLREGRFPCGKAQAKDVLKVTADGQDHAIVRYEREITLPADFDRIERACAPVTKPPVENTVGIEKTPAGWSVPSTKPQGATFLPPPGSTSYH